MGAVRAYDQKMKKKKRRREKAKARAAAEASAAAQRPREPEHRTLTPETKQMVMGILFVAQQIHPQGASSVD